MINMYLAFMKKLQKGDYQFTGQERVMANAYLPGLVERARYKGEFELLKPLITPDMAEGIVSTLTSEYAIKGYYKGFITFIEQCDDSAKNTMRAALTHDNYLWFRQAGETALQAALSLDDKSLLATMLKANAWEGAYTLKTSGRDKYRTCKPQSILQAVKEAGGDLLLAEMLTANDCRIFFDQDMKSVKLLYQAAEQLNDDAILKSIIAASPIFLGETLKNIAETNGSAKIVKEIMEFANRTGGQTVTEQLLAQDDFAAITNYEGDAELDTMLIGITKKSFNTELLPQLLKSEACRHRFGKLCGYGEKTSLNLFLETAASCTPPLVHTLCSSDDYAPIKNLCHHLSESEGLKAIQHILLLVEGEQRANIVNALPEKWQPLFAGKSTAEIQPIDSTPKVIRQVAVKGQDLWQSTLRMQAPEGLNHYSPINFKPKIYNELLPLFELEKDLGGNINPKESAYKMAVLFSHVSEAERYLDTYQKNPNWNRGDVDQWLHDALLFNVPQGENWDNGRWKDLVLKYGPAASKFLGLAPKIDAYISEHHADVPRTPVEIRDLACRVAYTRYNESLDFARTSIECGLSEKRFNEILDFLKAKGKQTDYLPNIQIDGTQIGHSNFYMEKLPPNDPKGLVLGELTNCCQSIGSDGSACAKHGASSPYGGFYVWKHKTNGRCTSDDTIVAQSWAWVGKDNALVFDSFERLGSRYDTLIQPFLEQMAYEVVGKHVIADESGGPVTAIHLGKGGKTPHLSCQNAEPSEPKDHNGYSDSKHQYYITPVNHISHAASASRILSADMQVRRG